MRPRDEGSCYHFHGDKDVLQLFASSYEALGSMARCYACTVHLNRTSC